MSNLAFCLGCTEALEDDGFKYCPNPLCSRFGLLTSLSSPRKSSLKDLKALKKDLAKSKGYATPVNDESFNKEREV